MRHIATFLLVGLILLAGCATPAFTLSPIPTPAPGDASPTAASSKAKIRFSYPSSPGIADIPFFMALDLLREQGYTVETEQFARFELNLAALVKGDLDIASSSLQPAWVAIGKDAPIRTIVARLKNADLLAVKSEITKCIDLADKNVGLNSAQTVNAVLLNQFVANRCPGTRFTVVSIPSSSNRMAALASGTIDATNLQVDDMLQLDQENPGKFHALVDFGAEFPDIQVFAFHAHQNFIAEHPEAVRDFIRAFLQASRRVQDRQVLRENLTKYLDLDSAMLDTAVTVFTEKKMWDVNGGLTAENVKTTLDFFIGAEAVPSSLTPEMVVELNSLATVLEEIGKE